MLANEIHDRTLDVDRRILRDHADVGVSGRRQFSAVIAAANDLVCILEATCIAVAPAPRQHSLRHIPGNKRSLWDRTKVRSEHIFY